MNAQTNMNKSKKKRCYLFPLCWRKVAGYIERQFVMKERFFVCQYHADKLEYKHEQETWSGDDWSKQEFIKF